MSKKLADFLTDAELVELLLSAQIYNGSDYSTTVRRHFIAQGRAVEAATIRAVLSYLSTVLTEERMKQIYSKLEEYE